MVTPSMYSANGRNTEDELRLVNMLLVVWLRMLGSLSGNEKFICLEIVQLVMLKVLKKYTIQTTSMEMANAARPFPR